MSGPRERSDPLGSHRYRSGPRGGYSRLPSFADAFAGCGGLSLGLMRAGWKGLFAIERDPFAFKTLSTNLPSGGGTFHYDWPNGIEQQAWDIKDLLAERRPALAALRGKVDLLAGGPPCQGFSVAGRRRPDDPRNSLFEAYLDLVDILDPPLVLLENVSGFTADFKVSDRDSVPNFAEALRQGLSATHDLASAIIRACDFGCAASTAQVLHGWHEEVRI